MQWVVEVFRWGRWCPIAFALSESQANDLAKLHMQSRVRELWR